MKKRDSFWNAEEMKAKGPEGEFNFFREGEIIDFLRYLNEHLNRLLDRAKFLGQQPCSEFNKNRECSLYFNEQSRKYSYLFRWAECYY